MKRLVSRAALLLAVTAAAQSSFATNYYFNANAGGSGNGSAASPFNSLGAAGSLDLNPGDHVYLRGTFDAPSGGLTLNANDSGTSAKPVTISSWGSTRATIDAVDSFGIRTLDAGGISVSNLNVVGSGPSSTDSTGLYTNTDSGIRFFNDSGKQNYVRVNNVSVSGFGENGIFVQGGSNESGFNDVKISNSSVFNNQRAGLSIAADFDTANRNAVTNVVIDHVKAYNNPGRANRPNEVNSGNGIVIGQVNGATIQNSVAYGNGSADASTNGGSVGIWAWDSNKITIQHNESYKNGTAGEHDGGGFDLDGGVTNSVMKNNYSHDNAGAGYLLAEFSNARNFAGNEVANNVSVDDGRKNGYGGLHAFGAIDSASVHDNTVYISPADKGQANTRDEAPAAIKVRGPQDKNIDFSNNLLIVKTDGRTEVYQPTKFENSDNASGISMDGNTYKLLSGDSSDPQAAALKSALDQLGSQLASGQVVAIDAQALSDYLKTTSDSVAVSDNTDTATNNDDVKKVINPPTEDISTLNPAVSTPTSVSLSPSRAAIPEPSSLGLIMVGASALLRRRRR